MMGRGLCALLLLGACAREPAAAEGVGAMGAIAAMGVAGAAPVPHAANVHGELDRLDTRQPLPLLPAMAHHQKHSMREHLEAVQAIVAALGRSDFEAIERAASSIGFSEQMGQMCTHMGAGAPGFAERAIEFHQTADRIAVAARARAGADVLMAFSATLQTCTSCHASWKQQLVDESTWQQLTAQAPTGSMH